MVEAPDDAALRDRVPPDQRELFDDLLVEARYGHSQREDIRGLCWNWPGGLLRRALLEAGRRLVDTGRVHDVGHAVELFPDELDRLLRGGPGPSADELAERAARRDLVEAAPPPRMLGEPEAPPPMEALPPAMARATAAMMANLEADATRREPGTDGMAPATTGQVGAASGSGSVRGHTEVERASCTI